MTRQRADTGQAGELHQTGGSEDALTTAQGVPVADNQNSLRVGPGTGPTLLQDNVLREKIFAFDHERIPERVVHARGYGAHGTFECTAPLTDVTTAHVLQKKGRTVPAFVRFSTVAGSRGSMDLARDVRGFAVKLYTEQGNWDIVGNNIPVFFIQDAMKFPDLVHAVKEEPDRGFPQAQSAHDNFWDFVSLMPESTHMLLWAMSDRAIPRSFRFMDGFGVNTYRLVDADGNGTFVKFHWRAVQGVQSVLWDEAVKINGADPDFHRRDLWEAISRDDHPQWDFGVQLIDDETAERLPFDVLDPTKLIPEEEVPIELVGRLTLDRLVDNDFAETEQAAFCTQNVVPGVDFSADPLLQGRNFSYLDTQLKRLGSPNFAQLPINAPRCPVANFYRDGHMQTEIPSGPASFEPSSYPADARGPRPQQASFQSLAQPVSGEIVRLRPESFADHYSQARQFWISQTPVEQEHIIDAFVFELSKVSSVEVRRTVVANLRNVHDDLAKPVAQDLGLRLPRPSEPFAPVQELPESPAVSILRTPPETFAGRKLGLLLTDGADAGLVAAVRQAAESRGAVVEVIAPRVGGAMLSDGSTEPAAQALRGAPSVLYDAVVILVGPESAEAIATEPSAKDFLTDAYHHQKFIGLGGAVEPLVDAAGLTDLDEGCVQLRTTSDATELLDLCSRIRHWDRVVHA